MTLKKKKYQIRWIYWLNNSYEIAMKKVVRLAAWLADWLQIVSFTNWKKKSNSIESFNEQTINKLESKKWREWNLFFLLSRKKILFFSNNSLGKRQSHLTHTHTHTISIFQTIKFPFLRSHTTAATTTTIQTQWQLIVSFFFFTISFVGKKILFSFHTNNKP